MCGVLFLALLACTAMALMPLHWDSRQHYPECYTGRSPRPEVSCQSSWAVGAAQVFGDRSCVYGVRHPNSCAVPRTGMSSQSILSCIQLPSWGTRVSEVIHSYRRIVRDMNTVVRAQEAALDQELDDESQDIQVAEAKADKIAQAEIEATAVGLREELGLNFTWERVPPNSLGVQVNITLLDTAHDKHPYNWRCGSPGNLYLAWKFIQEFGTLPLDCMTDLAVESSASCAAMPGCRDLSTTERSPCIQDKSTIPRALTLDQHRALLDSVGVSTGYSHLLEEGVCDKPALVYQPGNASLKDMVRGADPVRYRSGVISSTTGILSGASASPQGPLVSAMQAAIMAGGSVSACLSSTAFAGWNHGSRHDALPRELVCEVKRANEFSECVKVLGWGQRPPGPRRHAHQSTDPGDMLYWIVERVTGQLNEELWVFHRGRETPGTDWGQACGLEVTATWADPSCPSTLQSNHAAAHQDLLLYSESTSLFPVGL